MSGEPMSEEGGQRGGARRGGKFPRFGGSKRVAEPEEPLEFKNIGYLTRFVSPQGKIMSRKRTGFSGQHQRQLASAIKQARFMALMPFVGRG